MLALAMALTLAAAPRTAPAQRPAAAPEPAIATLEATFAYDLADANGVVPLTWPTLSYDRVHDELFLVGEGIARIFDASGMEVHRFGDDGSLGSISRVAPLDGGELIVLTTLDERRAYFRCDFRGEPLERLSLTGLPDGFADFDPDALLHRDGKLYFAERGNMRVVVTDLSGAHLRSFRLRDLVAAALPRDGDRKPPGSIDAFNVDAAGNVLFTMSTLFAGGVLTPTGEVRIFGSRGSRPGKFNIIGGIDADERGNVFVTDRLRSVVSVWDRELRHVGDFGYRGDGRMNLLTPYEIAVGNGKVFVAQAGNRGVRVYRVRLVEPPPEPGANTPAPRPESPRPREAPPPARGRGLG